MLACFIPSITDVTIVNTITRVTTVKGVTNIPTSILHTVPLTIVNLITHKQSCMLWEATIVQVVYNETLHLHRQAKNEQLIMGAVHPGH